MLPGYTYNSLIKKLREWDIFTRPSREKKVRADGRAGGPNIPIDLTDKAREKYRLGTLVLPELGVGRRTQLLHLILYFTDKTNQHEFEFYPADKQRLNEYLTRLLMNYCSVDKLRILGHVPREMEYVSSIVYDSPSPCLLIWKDEIRALNNESKYATIYRVKILGVSVGDVLYREDRPSWPWLKDIKLTFEEVQEAFDGLVEMGIMKVIGDIWGVTRFDFVDGWMSDIVTLLWADHELLLSQMGGRLHKRKLAATIRKWLAKYLGHNGADALIRSNYDTKNDSADWVDLVSDGYDKLKQIHKKKFDKYELLIELLSQMVYPM